MKEVTINTKYKDSVFRMLFNNKEDLLSLYNAVNGTHYNNVDDLEINTLEDGIFMKMKNDVSFVLSFELNLYEHQSTKCGNMSLRFLFYAADLFRGMVIKQDLYKRKEVVLKDFLIKNRAEVYSMSVFEYNEELHLKNVLEEGYDKAKSEYTAIIAEKDATIAEKNNAIAEKDNAIVKMNNALTEKDARIAELEELLAKTNR